MAIGFSNGISHVLFVASKLFLMRVYVKGILCGGLLDDVRNSRSCNAD